MLLFLVKQEVFIKERVSKFQKQLLLLELIILADILAYGQLHQHQQQRVLDQIMLLLQPEQFLESWFIN